jgi:hypothetical protein
MQDQQQYKPQRQVTLCLKLNLCQNIERETERKRNYSNGPIQMEVGSLLRKKNLGDRDNVDGDCTCAKKS